MKRGQSVEYQGQICVNVSRQLENKSFECRLGSIGKHFTKCQLCRLLKAFDGRVSGVKLNFTSVRCSSIAPNS